MDFLLYFQILLGQWQGVILKITYGCFRVISPFLPNKHRLGVFFFRFEDGPSKLIPWHCQENHILFHRHKGVAFIQLS